MTYLVTGAAGFIGFHVVAALLERGDQVVGADCLNDYYDPALKRARLDQIAARNGFTFEYADLADRDAAFALFDKYRVERVIHLAAQAGVRYSTVNPPAYIRSNIVGFQNVIDAARERHVTHFVFASTSSVYGVGNVVPFSTDQRTDHPASLYAATKKSNELVAHSYAHLFGLPVTGLRFFTVYGPWGRPDMAPFLFTSRILAGKPIQIFNNGAHARDFTYIDDCVRAVLKATDHTPTPDPDWSSASSDPASSLAPYRLYNVGSTRSVPILDFVATIEKAAGRKAVMEFLPFQPGDMLETHADIAPLARDTGYSPHVPLEEGIERFVAWYRRYYEVG